MLRERMTSPGGMSVRREIDARLAGARTAALEEAIAFLKRAGHDAAAEDLEQAAFGGQGNG